MKTIKQVWDWLEHRLELRDSIWPVMRHPVPAALAKPIGWMYVFGSMTLTLLMLQIVTGVCLAMIYQPTAADAYASLEYLNYEAPFGWLLRAIHYWSATGMVVMLMVHMTQVFLMGAFKYPRELTWLVGVGLLTTTLVLAFTGQVLRYDGDSYWGVSVAVSAAGRVPLAGPSIVHLILGGEYIGSETLSRFFTLHVFILPGLLIGLLVVHLYLVVKRGISEPPTPGEPVDKATYDEEYEKLLEKGIPFFPHALYRDGVACAMAVLIVVGLAVIFGPKGPGEIPDPTLIHAEPRPDWYFLPVFAMAALSPPSMETFLMLGLPVIGILALAAVPFVAGSGERSARRRPVAVLVVLVTFVTLMVLGWYGATSPWSPDMEAWSSTPVPDGIVEKLTPLELQGAVVFQNKCCRNCHALEGAGGKRGPDLTEVGIRMNPEAMVRQVVQGGGNMPAYAQQMNSAEVTALVAFLVKLRPAGIPPAAVPSAAAESLVAAPTDAP
ncbi:cytochrome b N-terminal domain-containing protein [Blastopirellula sp. J2-11]|uniref:cytochrome b N-terminal domain-containing protein n=1 Tax=Blastopirellula sp. J2-11 TaxID=2943192 RepID=UPI0021C9906F|nr:cytochrome b N-terminal domain-containing protein [Blastopirellula sp. J2-11]UUO06955.1 cytochrome b N-terminal domain-containing protein [Blastopirellula sp. J2-11]